MAADRTRSRVERLRQLEELLGLRPYGVVELARTLGVGRRSIERDLVYLTEEYGERLVRDEAHRYRLRSRAALLNDVEALALYMAARMLTHTGIGERHYRSTMTKLAQQVPEPAQSALLRRVDALRSKDRDRVLDVVAQAWFGRRVLRCAYESAAGRRSKRDLEVYFVEVGRRNHEPYALAVDRAAPGRVLVFKFARMREVRLLDETYEIPEGFDPDEVIGDAFGVIVGESVRVTLRLVPGVAMAFREVAGDSLVSLEDHEDGGALAVVRATLDGRGRALELVPWLMGWGDAVEVLEPASVREDVAAALSRAAARYEQR
ncbi:MAG: WYL domain-containing protein [Trueperaceae bacterium]|nr:MAG: WYL domain-containing protein [Trueperaceae bacterium]